MSGAEFLGDEAPHAPSEDGDESDRNKGDEVLLRALEDDVQPPVAAEPGEGPFDHPADAGGNEPSVAAAGNGLDGDAECLTRLGQASAPIAEIAEGWAVEAAIGEFTQNRHDTLRVVPVRRRDIDRHRMPYLSTAIWILTPRIFLPPSMPRAKQLGAERQERLSMTTALGSGASAQARRQVRRSLASSRRHRPSRLQRANSP